MCYHDDGDACACRKPHPGMLRDAASAYSGLCNPAHEVRDLPDAARRIVALAEHVATEG